MADQTLTVFPEQLAEMSVSQLANLTHAQKCEVDVNLTQASTWLKQARTKFDTALEQCYGDKARAALLESGRDFGTAHIADGHLEIILELPKRVSWDQKKLAEIADRIAAAGDRVQDYSRDRQALLGAVMKDRHEMLGLFTTSQGQRSQRQPLSHRRPQALSHRLGVLFQSVPERLSLALRILDACVGQGFATGGCRA